VAVEGVVSGNWRRLGDEEEGVRAIAWSWMLVDSARTPMANNIFWIIYNNNNKVWFVTNGTS
jgi:hypothetical protein